MNIKTICSFGIKVIAAGVAGIAVFLGIGRLSKTKKCRTGDPSELETDSLNVSEQQLPQEAEPASNDNIMNGLKKVQDITYIPTYRIVTSNGGLSSSFVDGGIRGQKRLLKFEGVKIKNNKVNLSKFGFRFW